MKNFYLLLAVAVLVFGAAFEAGGQNVRTDTLTLDVKFRDASAAIDLGYRDNGNNIAAFEQALKAYLEDPDAAIRTINVRTSASPSGTTDANRRLAANRAKSIETLLADKLGLDRSLFNIEPIGEDWEGLGRLVAKLDTSWRDEVLDIINSSSAPERGDDPRKNQIRHINDGQVYWYLSEYLFPELRAAGGSVACVIGTPEPEAEPEPEPEAPRRDTVYVQRIDTIYVHQNDTVLPSFGALDVNDLEEYMRHRNDLDLTGKQMIMAVRTNVLAVPLANFGIEVPLGERFSVGADYYYPWLWRPMHKEGLDADGRCFELQAIDIEGRYWFPGSKKLPQQRLLGHSVGLYAAAGHYDFERNFTGHQGEFYNVGVDYLYSMPIWGNRMHLEFELGIGYIYSPAQPYDTFVAGDKAYRRTGYTNITRWFGPTRAQFSLVVPIYIKKGGEQ